MPEVEETRWRQQHGTFHHDFADKVLQALNGEEPPKGSPLTTLALGSLTYRDICKGHVGGYSETKEIQDYLCPRVYKIDPTTRTATFTEKGSYVKTEADGGPVQVLKPYWLG